VTWRKLNLNMPNLPVFDIEIKDADVVIATHGMGFWILDDISPLRQYAPELAGKKAHLFEPEDHTRFGYNWWVDYGGGPPSEEKYFFVRNAEPGYTFYERGVVDGEKFRDFIDAGDARPLGPMFYYLLSDQASEVSLAILDAEGNEIRGWGMDEIPTERFASFDNRGYGQDLVTGQPAVNVGAGLNRFVWDMRYPSVSPIPGLPPVILNPIAAPGTYQVRLMVDGEVQTQSFELKINPNETYTREQTDAKKNAWMALYRQAEKGVQAVLRAQAARDRVMSATEGSGASAEQAKKIVDIATEFEASMVATGTTLVQIISEPTKPLSLLVTLHNVLEHSEGPPNQPWHEVFDKVAGEMDAKIAEFDAALEKAMASFE
jgi:hypothetical protein